MMRAIFPILLMSVFLFSACGNRFDLSTERGRQARIDEANLALSIGECQSAIDAINPLFNSEFVNGEIRVVKASAEACFAGFDTLALLTNMPTSTNIYVAMAKSVNAVQDDGKVEALYRAVDILTQNGSALGADIRETTENNLMFFLSLGVMGAIISGYGQAASDGVQVITIEYIPGGGAGTFSNIDACGFAAAHSHLSNSFYFSALAENADVAEAFDTIDDACALTRVATCKGLTRIRTDCDGANARSLQANILIGAVDAVW